MARGGALSAYREKRDFAKTPEPPPRLGRKKGWSYVIQKHAATRLHYDFRLELDGVLKSWAVTRGPSLNPADKRLAVEVEDHPIEYGGFEGIIPKGEYGGGTVMLWDRGSWEPVGDPHKGLEKGELKFVLSGKRLHGKFVLVRMKRRPGEKRDNWLLIKEKDAEVDTGELVIDRYDTSVATNRTMDEIKSGKSRMWTREKGEIKAQDRPKAKKATAAAPPAARGSAKLPAIVPPQLATPVEHPPNGPQWRHEIKYDGYRILAAVAGGRAKLYSRNKLDWTPRFKPIAAALGNLDVESVLLDGEAVVFDDKGRSSFSALQESLSEGHDDKVYVVFDILELDGKDLKRKPLSERTEILEGVLKTNGRGLIRLGGYLQGDAAKIFTSACSMGAEGLVSKRVDRPYVSARTQSWVKSKCLNAEEFVIIGYRPSDKKGRPFASLLIGEYDGGELIYRGRVGTGFDDKMLRDLQKRLDALAVEEPAAANIPADIRRRAKWVKPQLVAQISYIERTPDGVLRYPSFVGLREDKPAREVKMRPPEPPPMPSPKPQKAAAKPKASKPGIGAAIKLTHPDKIVYPDIGLTKRALFEYYEAAASWMLAHTKDRPASVVRCPDGAAKKCFFQKNHMAGFEAFGHVAVAESDGGTADYFNIKNELSILSGVQMGVFEFHIWGSRADNIELPDRLVFDLDPDEEMPFAQVAQAAADVRDVLDAAGLKTFPLVTGGKGIHVVVPIARKRSFEEMKPFCAGVARHLSAADPKRFIAKMSKSARKGKIFVDFLRNERGSTAIAPYSTRARPGAPVAIPVTWGELTRLKAANVFGIDAALERVRAQKSDPWREYFSLRQSLSAKAFGFFAGTG